MLSGTTATQKSTRGLQILSTRTTVMLCGRRLIHRNGTLNRMLIQHTPARSSSQSCKGTPWTRPRSPLLITFPTLSLEMPLQLTSHRAPAGTLRERAVARTAGVARVGVTLGGRGQHRPPDITHAARAPEQATWRPYGRSSGEAPRASGTTERTSATLERLISNTNRLARGSGWRAPQSGLTQVRSLPTKVSCPCLLRLLQRQSPAA